MFSLHPRLLDFIQFCMFLMLRLFFRPTQQELLKFSLLVLLSLLNLLNLIIPPVLFRSIGLCFRGKGAPETALLRLSLLILSHHTYNILLRGRFSCLEKGLGFSEAKLESLTGYHNP